MKVFFSRINNILRFPAKVSNNYSLPVTFTSNINHKSSNCLFRVQLVTFSKKEGSVLRQYVSNKLEVNKEMDQNKISAKLLCELIGTKYYPTNDEIKLDPFTVVTVYDELDNLLGHKNLVDALSYAKELKKDVVLKNEKVNPPIVKVMKYRINLLKRLIKKLSKKSLPGKSIQREKEKSMKFILLGLNISKNDLDTKISRCKEYLRHFTNIRVAVKLESLDKTEELRASNLLKNLSSNLNEYASLKVQPTFEICKKLLDKQDYENLANENNDGVDDEKGKIESAIEEVKFGKKDIDQSISKFEKFGNSQVMYIELQSLIIDASGIDFEKLLESVNVDDLLKGFSQQSFIEKFSIADPKENKIKEEKIENAKEEEIEFSEELTNLGLEKDTKHKLQITNQKNFKSLNFENKLNFLDNEASKAESFSEKMKKNQIRDQIKTDITSQTKYLLFKKINLKVLKYTLEIEKRKLGTTALDEETLSTKKVKKQDEKKKNA